MRSFRWFALAAAATLCASAADNLMDAFKGKMKEGLYEYKMDMDMGQMPGMPPGMGKQNMTFQHCLSAQDIEKGEMGRIGRQGRPSGDCEMQNLRTSGNTATYTMVCKGGAKGGEMVADNRITFRGDGYTMDVKTAMKQGAQTMNMAQHMEARYLGACKK